MEDKVDSDPSPGKEVQSAERDSGTLWVPPSQSSSARPRWALPVLLVGLVCLLVVAVVSALYFAGQAEGDAPSLALAYLVLLGPFLLIGLPLVLAGSLGLARPWAHRRPWLPIAIVAAGVGLFLFALEGPGLLFTKPVMRGTATVAGLPGQTSVWSGSVECTQAGPLLQVEAAIAGSTLSREVLSRSRNPMAGGLADDSPAYEISLDVADDEAHLTVWSSGFGSSAPAAAQVVEPGGRRGTYRSTPKSINHVDDPPSVIDVTWDCGEAQ